MTGAPDRVWLCAAEGPRVVRPAKPQQRPVADALRRPSRPRLPLRHAAAEVLSLIHIYPRGVLLEKEVGGQEVNIRNLSGNRTLVEFGAGDEVQVTAGPDGVRFLLVAGAPIQEPVAWHGPIVMNTRAELETAKMCIRDSPSCFGPIWACMSTGTRSG